MADDSDGKPDLAAGVPFKSIPDGGILAGLVSDEAVLLTRSGQEVRAFSSKCTHLGAPLEKGLIVDGSLRCPWHHACFDLRTGDAVTAPAFDPLEEWQVVREGDRVAVSGRNTAPHTAERSFEGHSQPGIVIVGGGAAGYAAAHEARRLGHEGPITMVSNENTAPYDRTLLTKDYLDGAFGDDKLPIARTTLEDLGVTFIRGVAANCIEADRHLLHLDDGRTLPYTKLLLATGAEPNRLDVPGSDLPHVHVLRSLADCRAILDGLKPGCSVVVVGSSFIGLEAAASIRSKGFDVTVATPEQQPMVKVLGPDLAQTIIDVHRVQGVRLELGRRVRAITVETVTFEDGGSLPADLVVVGIGVKPRVALAEQAGLSVQNGIVVDGHLATSEPDIYAAGDIACWPDAHSGQRIRVEHWAVAERQGQTAARNLLGGADTFEAVPFFWTKHFDFSVRYVGHATEWDRVDIDGDLARKSAVLRFMRASRVVAVATVERDVAALEAEAAMEREIAGSH